MCTRVCKCACDPLPDCKPAKGGSRTSGSVTAASSRRPLKWCCLGFHGKAGSSCQVPQRPPDCVQPWDLAFPHLTGQGPSVPRGSHCGRSQMQTTRRKKTDKSIPFGDEQTEFTAVHKHGLGRGSGCALGSPVAVPGTDGPQAVHTGPALMGGPRLETRIPCGLGSQLVTPQESGQCSRNPHPAALESGLTLPDEDATALLATTRGALYGHVD